MSQHHCGGMLHVYQYPETVCKCGEQPVPKGILRHYDHPSHILTRCTLILSVAMLVAMLMLIYVAIGGRV